MPTTSLGFPQSIIGLPGWAQSQNQGWALLNQFLTGTASLPALAVTGNLTVGGSVTASSFVGFGGASFLLSSMYGIANGVAQLNANAQLPGATIAGNALATVAFSATPAFNAATANAFNVTLTGNVTSSTFANGTSAAGPFIAFRITQDATGGRTWTWPANVRKGGTINPGANQESTQLFLLQTDGSLDAASPMM
jgi:hypothetical protein